MNWRGAAYCPLGHWRLQPARDEAKWMEPLLPCAAMAMLDWPQRQGHGVWLEQRR